MALLSVIIPCHHQAGFLRDLVDELLAELPGALELIVVDDGSHRDSPAEALRGSPVRLLRKDRAQGPSAARNLGLRAATGRMIGFIDADDRILPGALAAAVREFDGLPHASGLCGAIAGFIDARGLPLNPENSDTLLPSPPVETLNYDFFREGGRLVPNIGRFLFRRDPLLSLGGFEEGLHRAEDWDFLLRFVRCHRMAVTRNGWLRYRIHGNNGTLRLGGNQLHGDPRSVASGRLVRMSHGLSG